MTYALTWLPQVLLSAGLKVAEVSGWQTRGRGEFGRTLGVLCHHTAGPKNGNMPSLHTLAHGRRNLRGPLAQLGLGRDGTFYVIAAGRANHAGAGSWMGLSAGNLHLIGIEAENTGLPDDPWPSAQFDAYACGVAALLKHAGLDAERCAGHKEYAPRRKIDPSFDMRAFRDQVSARMRSDTAQALIPKRETTPLGAATAGRPTLRRGASEQAVRDLRRLLELSEAGGFDGPLEAEVRAFQRLHGLLPDGIVGPKTWAALDVRARAA